MAKKELLQLVFKKITVNDGRIVKIELFEPFKRLYKELKCSVTQTKIGRGENSYILELLVGQWMRLPLMIKKIF